jgi:hypothetical protein
MRTKFYLTVSLLFVCALFFSIGYVAQAEEKAAPLLVLTQVDTAFTYQGYLEEAGSPAQGSYDFLFRLFNAASGGVQAGGDNVRGDVPVARGVFTTVLDFGPEFNGRALWLEIAVRPGISTGDYTILLPRQLLTAVPYALSLRPGAVIQNKSGSGHGLEVWSDASTHLGTSLWVENENATSGIALWGRAQGTDATIISSNTSTGALFKGFGGDGGEHEFIVENDGDLWTKGDILQGLEGRGSVKAGAVVYCNSSGALLYDSFNNVSGTMSIADGATPGYCYIDFGFDPSTHFWVTSNYNVMTITVPTCSLDLDNDNRLYCRTVGMDGVSTPGMFMLLLY